MNRQLEMTFDGSTFDQQIDGRRLTNQFQVIFDLMKDGLFRTLKQIHNATGYPEASISSRIRDFRKPKHGGHVVNSVRIKNGSWTYQLIVKDENE